jgi:hypothetical protein
MAAKSLSEVLILPKVIFAEAVAGGLRRANTPYQRGPHSAIYMTQRVTTGNSATARNASVLPPGSGREPSPPQADFSIVTQAAALLLP